MSRKPFKLSDTDKYLKPIHLAGKTVTYTITHVGAIRVEPRQKEMVLSGDNPQEVENAQDLVFVLHFRETQKPLRLTSNENKHELLQVCGDEPDNIVGAQVTLTTKTQKNFGREYIAISKVEKPRSAKSDPAPYRTERLKQLRTLRQEEKGLLAASGIEQKQYTTDEISALTIEEIEQSIEQTEHNVLDLKASREPARR